MTSVCRWPCENSRADLAHVRPAGLRGLRLRRKERLRLGFCTQQVFYLSADNFKRWANILGTVVFLNIKRFVNVHMTHMAMLTG